MTVETVPVAMLAPTLGSTFSLTSLQVTWLALTGAATGGSSIDSYNLQFDSSTNGVTFTDLLGEDSNFQVGLTHTETGLTAGNTY